MNNKETLQSYNINLSENNNALSSILETINNLPEASGGSKPTTDEEVIIAIKDTINARIEPILQLPETYDYYTTEPVTIYKPLDSFNHYIIRKRGANSYGILWFNGGWIQFASTANVADMRTMGITFNSGNKVFADVETLVESITFNTSGTLIQQGLYSENFPSLDEAIAAIQDPNTQYSSTNNTLWGNQIDDGGVYRVCATNIPMFDYYGEPLKCRKISSNETIVSK